MKNVMAGVLTVLLFLGLMGACANGGKREYAPAPTPAPSAFTPRPYLTPDPADDVEAVESTEDSDSDVDVDHDDDDRRNSRWCPTRWC